MSSAKWKKCNWYVDSPTVAQNNDPVGNIDILTILLKWLCLVKETKTTVAEPKQNKSTQLLLGWNLLLDLFYKTVETFWYYRVSHSEVFCKKTFRNILWNSWQELFNNFPLQNFPPFFSDCRMILENIEVKGGLANIWFMMFV